MISILACAIALNSNQRVAPPASEPTQIKYKIKLYDHNGLISAPKLFTLEGHEARISETGGKHELMVSVLPHVNSNFSIGTELALSIDGVSALHARFNTKSGEEAYLRIQKVKSGNSTLLIATESPLRTKMGKDDLLAVITSSEVPPPGSDPFLPHQRPTELSGIPPTQINYKIVIRDKKGVVYKPVVRTLAGQPCLVQTDGVLGNVEIRLLPNDSAGGRISNMLQFTFNNDDPAGATWSSKSGAPSYFKLWKEDAATPRMLPLASRPKALKSGELLIEITGSNIQGK